MKFTVKDPQNGYYGFKNETTCYVGNTLSDAALFTTESAKQLLVDLNNPLLVITNYSSEQLNELSFDLIDTDSILSTKKAQSIFKHQQLIKSTANAFVLVDDQINKLTNDDLYNGLNELSQKQFQGTNQL